MKRLVGIFLLLVMVCGSFPAIGVEQESISSFPYFLEGVTPRGGPTMKRMFQMLMKKETAVFSYPYEVSAGTTISVPATPSYVIITSDGVASGNAVDIATTSAKDGQLMFIANRDAQTTSGDITLTQNQVGLLVFSNADWRAVSNPGAVTAAVAAAIAAAILADNATDSANLAAGILADNATDAALIASEILADNATDAALIASEIAADNATDVAAIDAAVLADNATDTENIDAAILADNATDTAAIDAAIAADNASDTLLFAPIPLAASDTTLGLCAEYTVVTGSVITIKDGLITAITGP